MLLSLGVVVAMMLVTVGATGLCSVNPEGSNYARNNPVDASTFLDLESRATDTPLRDPGMPEGWSPNSARRTTVGGQPAAVVGWVTAEDNFVQAVQTSVELDAAMKGFDGKFRPNKTVEHVGGTAVHVWSSDERGIRPLWGVDLGDARLLITGVAPAQDFETVLRAFEEAQPLPN